MIGRVAVDARVDQRSAERKSSPVRKPLSDLTALGRELSDVAIIPYRQTRPGAEFESAEAA